MLTKLEAPVLYTNDIEKAKKYYVDALGFQVVDDQGKFVYLALGDTKIGLNVADKPNKVPGHQTIILKSDDIEGDYEALKNKGIAMELELQDLGFGKTFVFRDPDDNKIMVIE
ncbi:MAG: VOC family protein [Patescibacteria group bacterium]|nr:VOC family protein [Patescibacteria group bacterium]